MAFKARFPGRCHRCTEDIHEGDMVKFVDDLLVHEHCVPVAAVAKRKEEICSRCFLVRPCEHDE